LVEIFYLATPLKNCGFEKKGSYQRKSTEATSNSYCLFKKIIRRGRDLQRKTLREARTSYDLDTVSKTPLGENPVDKR
jgi:hypothetical protein